MSTPTNSYFKYVLYLLIWAQHRTAEWHVRTPKTVKCYPATSSSGKHQMLFQILTAPQSPLTILYSGGTYQCMHFKFMSIRVISRYCIKIFIRISINRINLCSNEVQWRNYQGSGGVTALGIVINNLFNRSMYSKMWPLTEDVRRIPRAPRGGHSLTARLRKGDQFSKWATP